MKGLTPSFKVSSVLSVDLPEVPALSLVKERLPQIFPDGLENRNYCIREMAARSVWVMLYVGAVEGLDRWIRPSQVTDMGTAQSRRVSRSEREAWHRMTLGQKKERPVDAWYAPNSREPIRDETLRQGLISTGAVIERPGLPVTSSLPRYALEASFAALFDKALDKKTFEARADAWRGGHLSKDALARVLLVRKGVAGAVAAIPVRLPSGEMRNMQAGSSSVIAKAVIEEFAPRFLHTPGLLWLSESGNKVVASDDRTAKRLGLCIDPSKALPDIILVNLGPDVLMVFVEVVASDGPINQLRKEALTTIAVEAGFNPAQLAFVTAFDDRNAPPARALMPNLAWGSFVWFRSEPDRIVVLRDGTPTPITKLRQN